MRKVCVAALACAALLVSTAPAHAAGAGDATLQRYAADTWASFVAMADPASGLPTDQLHADGSRDVQTSTTNIGAYMWSAVAAERLGIVRRTELVARMSTTVSTRSPRPTSSAPYARRSASRSSPWRRAAARSPARRARIA